MHSHSMFTSEYVHLLIILAHGGPTDECYFFSLTLENISENWKNPSPFIWYESGSFMNSSWLIFPHVHPKIYHFCFPVYTVKTFNNANSYQDIFIQYGVWHHFKNSCLLVQCTLSEFTITWQPSEFFNGVLSRLLVQNLATTHWVVSVVCQLLHTSVIILKGKDSPLWGPRFNKSDLPCSPPAKIQYICFPNKI